MEVKVKEEYKPSIQESVKLNTNAIYIDTLKKDRSQDYNQIILNIIFYTIQKAITC